MRTFPETQTVFVVDQCAASLETLGLMIPYETYRVDPTQTFPNQNTQVGVKTRRVSPRTADEMETLRKQTKALSFHPDSLESIWNQYQASKQMMFALDTARMPPRAFAFYRPFHVKPYQEWGIYIFVDKLLDYSDTFYEMLGSKIAAFTEETLLYCVLFEMFHHEFFHHIVESTATTLELVATRLGESRTIYRDYSKIRDDRDRHPHAPLEEALANAYGYNSFSFQARTESGYKLILMRMYQKVLKRHFLLEEDGYRHATHYLGGDYVKGATALLDLLLNTRQDEFDDDGLYPIANRVMPRGHTAYAEKPEIPTYLVGDDASLKKFFDLIPAPCETYTRLFWHMDTEELDKYFQKKSEEKRAQKNLVVQKTLGL